MKKLSLLILALGLAFLFSSCAINKKLPEAETEPKKPPVPEYINPYPEGTYEYFMARQEYYKDLSIYKHPVAYDAASPSQTSIVLDLNTLRGKLYDGNKTVILDYPIAPGTAKHPTPRGNFKIMEKIVDKESNLYGKMLDAAGNVVNAEADVRKHSPPPGGRFDGADMPYWMRLTGYGIGMHQGFVPTNPRRTASHGCIRHTMEGVQLIFAKVKTGTPVTIK